MDRDIKEYKAWMQALPGGICEFVCNSCLSIRSANSFFYQIYGYTEESAADASFSSLSFCTYPLDFPKVKRAVEEGLLCRSNRFEVEMRQVSAEGKIIWVAAKCSFSAEDSSLVNGIFFDITASKEREIRLREKEEEYRVAITQHTGKIMLRYDIKSKVQRCSEWAAEILQIPLVLENVPYSMLEADRIEEESTGEYIEFYESMVQGFPCGSCMFKMKDGRWIRSDYTLLCDEEGEPQRAVISCEDFTEQRERAFAYEKWQHYNESLLKDSIAYYECNLTKNLFDRIDGSLAAYLPEQERRSFEKVVRYAAQNFVYPNDRSQYLRLFSREKLLSRYYTGKKEIEGRYRRVDSKGRVFWAETVIQLLPDPYSEDVKGFVLIRDIDKEKREEEELQKRSRSDALTGALNRRTVAESVDAALQAAKERGHVFIMLDLDNFKQLNDTLGHLFGDQVLQESAQSLKQIVGEEGIVGRMGGDEFAVYAAFSEDGREEIFRKIEEIRQALHRNFESSISVSASLGVAFSPEDGTTFLELYKNADLALYEAKRCGRNQYIIFSQELLKKDDFQIMQGADQKSRGGRESAESERYRFMLEQTGVAVMEWNDQCGAPFLSERIKMFSFSSHIGSWIQPDFLLAADMHQEDWKWSRKILLSLKNGRDEARMTLRLSMISGEFLWCKVKIKVFRDTGKRLHRTLIVIQDVDEMTKKLRQKMYREEYDILTGYYNFEKFRKVADHLLDKRGSKNYALWYCDLKNFKFINDIYGYETGDCILRYWSRMIAESMNASETFARRSADHFVILRLYTDEEMIKKQFAQEARMLENCEEMHGKKFQLEMAAGIYRIEQEADLLSMEDMVDRASLAQRRAKAKVGSSLAVYSEEMRRRIIYEKEIEADMHHALQARQFQIYLQPQVEIQEAQWLSGAEALVRWQRFGEVIVSPQDFIPLFEKNGFIIQLDRFVFEEVCRYLRRRIERCEPLFKIAVNVSRVTAFQSDFAAQYIKIKESYDIPDNYLEIEFTETIVVENVRLLNQIMQRMRRHGFTFSLDDFGAGYSSLNMLKDIVVEVLKLDMLFFSSGLMLERDAVIVASVIAMAKGLDMEVIAEGVEMKEQVERLKAMGCDLVQGYYFGRPVPLELFDQKYVKLLHPRLQ